MLTSFDQDPRLDLTSVVISVLLTLSGLGANRTKLNTPPLHNASMAPILQATLLLDLQVKRFPADVPLRLLLIQLYLLLGCASIAHQLWTPLDVKRTILDALAPLFFDRLGSIAPGLFIGARPVIEPVLSHYNSVLAHSYPLRVWDAFSSGSYASILDIVEYDDRLRRSCTMVMAIVEDRRATRAFGGKMDGAIDEVPLVATIDDETILMNATDYGSFPNLESSFGPPLHDIVRLGPHPSNERSHLALLAERFLDLVTFKAPKDYKPTKVHEVAAKERAYNVEILSQLSNSFVTFLHADAMPNSLTDAEHAQYTILSLLSSALLIVFSIPKTDPLPPTLAQLTATLRSSLESFRDTVVRPLSARPDGATADGQPSSQATDPLFLTITDPHSLSTLRDVALAVRHGASFALSFHDREAARDRTGKSNLHKESVAELRALGALATLVLTATKARAKEVKDRLGEGGWLDRVAEWTLGAEGEREGSLREGDEVTKAVYGFLADGEEGGSVVEEWAGRVVESWQEGWKGLGMVKMDV
jgi:N-terminal acetyltransferase B complex non-catalytic subunit